MASLLQTTQSRTTPGEVRVRGRLEFGALLVGVVVMAVEFGFALYSELWFPRLGADRSTFFVWPLSERVVFHLPAALLGLSGLIGGVVLYRAVRGRTRWSWAMATLAPVAAFLVIHHPPVDHAMEILYVRDAGLPWGAPLYWTHAPVGNAALSLGLQVGVYAAALSCFLTLVLSTRRLSLSRRRRG